MKRSVMGHVIERAERLFKPRLIGGVIFDGGGDIDLPGVNIPGRQDTSGNADTATRLKNPVKINGMEFDGTGDIVTTKWGQSISITIGNVTRVVDGSKDLEYKVEDIGAADRVHSHGISDVNGLGDVLAGLVETSDVRMSDAREWTAPTMTVGEFDGGLVGERRALTPVVLKDVLTSWWSTKSHQDIPSIPISKVTGLSGELDGKVDVVGGYGLSQENFTTAEKSKLAGLESSRFKGTYLTLGDLEVNHPAPIPGSYADVDGGVGREVQRYIWDDSDEEWVPQSGVAPALTSADVKNLYESNPDTNAFTDAYKSKLSGIATGATKNASDAQLRDRSTHYGSQAISTITGLQDELNKGNDAYGWGNHASAGYVKTDTKYTAGSGLSLSGTEFRVSLDQSHIPRVIPADMRVNSIGVPAIGNPNGYIDQHGTINSRLITSGPENALAKDQMNTIELSTNASIEGIHGNHTGIRLIAYGMNGWGTAKLGIQIGIGWKQYGPIYQVIHSGNLATSLGSSTVVPMTQKAVTDAIGDINAILDLINGETP